MTTGVTWVAIAAFALAVISLGWQILTAIRRRPRIKVGLRREAHYAEFNEHDEMVHPDRVTFHVTVQNPGAEEIWINDAGLVADGVHLGLASSKSSVTRIKIGPDGMSGGMEVAGGRTNVSFPTAIPARGHVSFQVHDALTNRRDDGLLWRGFAELYRAGKEPRRILSRERAARLQ